MFGYPKLTTEEDVDFLEKAYPIVKGVRKKILNFFGLFEGREVRRVALALEEGYTDGERNGERNGEIKTMRNVIICALRNRFPNERENFFSSCAKKLEEKNNDELKNAFNVSMRCSNANEFVESL